MRRCSADESIIKLNQTQQLTPVTAKNPGRRRIYFLTDMEVTHSFVDVT